MSPKVLGWTGALVAVVCAIVAPLNQPDFRLGTRFIPTALGATIGVVCLVALIQATRRRPPVLAPVAAGTIRKRELVGAGVRSTTAGRPAPPPRPPEAADRPPPPPPTMASRLHRLVPRLGLALMVWSLLSALLSDRPAISLVGLYVDGAGAIFICALVGLWALGRAAGRTTPVIRDALLAVVVANAAVAVLQSLGFTPFGIPLFGGRAPGFMANPIYMSQVLVGGWWLAADRFHKTRGWWWLVAVAVIAAAIQGAGSRSILVILAAALLVSFVALDWRTGLAVGAASVLAMLALTTGITNPGDTGSSRVRNTSDFGARLDTWRGALRAAEARPILGWGPARFRAATARYKTVRTARIDGPEALYTDAHDLAVNYLVTIGGGGLLLLAAFLGAAFWSSRWRDPLMGFALLGLLGHVLEPQTAFATPLVFLALGAAGADDEGTRVPLPAYLGAGALALACWTLVAVGSWNLSRPGATPEATFAKLRTARSLLYPWREADSLSGRVSGRLTALGVGDYSAQAVRYLRGAAQKEPDDPAVWSDLADEQRALGDLTGARASLERGLRISPQSVVLRVDLAQLDAQEGDLAAARHLYEEALAIVPDSPKALDGLAHLAR